MLHKKLLRLLQKVNITQQIVRYRYEISIAFAIVVITAIIPIRGEFNYRYQRGSKWQYETLIASVDFPILKNSTELREERNKIKETTPPIYSKKSNQILLLKLQEQLSQTVANEQGIDEKESKNIFRLIEELYKRGVVDLLPENSFTGSYITLISPDGELSYQPITSIISPDQAYLKLYNFMEEQRFPLLLLSELYPSGIVTPNLIFNSEASQLSVKKRMEDISPTKGIVYAGQPIVVSDELITAEIEQILDSYRTEWEISVGFTGNRYHIKIGQLFFVLSITLIILFTLSYMPKELHPNRRGVLLLMLLMAMVVVVLSKRVEINENYLYAIPFSVIVLYLYSFFFNALVLPLYMILLTPILIMSSRGVELYLINIIAGGAAFYTFRIWSKGWLQFLNAAVIFITLCLSYFALRLIGGGSVTTIDSGVLLYLGWNSLLVVATYPLLFLFEKIFALLSNSRLHELSDPTTKLLTRLAKEAPGTFHHSLQVANLAESAALEIGANPTLARVGALYHDIGKLYNPLYFVENMRLGEGRIDPHLELSYKQSAAIILAHIPDGIELAEKMRLPRIVQGFIESHHGTTQSRYFYNLYLNEGGDPSAVSDFTYKGRLPISKEESIVMIADTIEAASRTLKDFSTETISKFVESMVEQKISEGQLVQSSITLFELEMVKIVIKEKLAQYHHNRIEYPTLKK